MYTIDAYARTLTLTQKGVYSERVTHCDREGERGSGHITASHDNRFEVVEEEWRVANKRTIGARREGQGGCHCEVACA